jgi:PPM family protein phosphatase
MEYGVKTDTGRVRGNNEDSFGVAPELNLFVLSDGMGGKASGEIASQITTEEIVAHCRDANADANFPLIGDRIPDVSETSNRLVSAIRRANQEIHDAAERHPEHEGMGATVVAAWIRGDRMSLAHIGDSRAYRLRNSSLEQLTQDHSFIAEQVRQGVITAEGANNSQMHNVLLRALGVDAEAEIDVNEELIIEGDTFLLCTDGLTREASDAQIAAILEEADDAQQAADQLVDFANQAGGSDNITAIVLRSAPRAVGVAGHVGRFGRWLVGASS